MLWVCIVSYKQDKFIEPMLEALTGFPNKLFVLDKCCDGSEQHLKRLGISYMNVSCEGHGAAYARNAGAIAIIENFPDADILFLDGDRIPHNLFYHDILEGLKQFDELLFMCKSDCRMMRRLTAEGAMRQFNIDLRYKHKGLESRWNLWNPFYTCGFAMRNAAIRQIMNVQEGNLFAAILMGCYGYEDNVLGIECAMLGHRMAFMPSEVYLEGWVGNDGSHNSTEVYQREKANYAIDCFAQLVGYKG
jgi:hypothetical protein